jgi:hypothetical protein
VKNMRGRYFTALLLSVLLLGAVYPDAVLAQIPGNVGNIAIQPYWTNVSSVSVSLSSSGKTAYCDATVSAYSGTTKIAAIMVLEQKNADGTYSHVKTWSGLSTISSYLSVGKTHTITPGRTYRLTITADVTRNGTTETVSNWAERSL